MKIAAYALALILGMPFFFRFYTEYMGWAMKVPLKTPALTLPGIENQMRHHQEIIDRLEKDRQDRDWQKIIEHHRRMPLADDCWRWEK